MKRVVSAMVALLAVLGLSALAIGQEALAFKAELSGGEEVPAVATAAGGDAKLRVNAAQTEIAFELEVRDGTDMLAQAGAHLHCAARGQNGPVVAFLVGQIPGGFDGAFEMKAVLTAANITNTACGATIAALVQSMRDGNVYVNVHSAAHPAGEIRGQVVADGL